MFIQAIWEWWSVTFREIVKYWLDIQEQWWSQLTVEMMTSDVDIIVIKNPKKSESKVCYLTLSHTEFCFTKSFVLYLSSSYSKVLKVQFTLLFSGWYLDRHLMFSARMIFLFYMMINSLVVIPTSLISLKY